MSSVQTLMDESSDRASAFARTLDGEDLQRRTPAALAGEADPRTSASYKFLSTERIIEALRSVGFLPVQASQVRSRRMSPRFAPHVIRFRRRYETVQLRDSIPEILCLNSHNGRTALQFRLALYRPICTNGLIVCSEALPVWRVPHRGDVFDQAIAAVVQQAEQFAEIGRWVERMEQTRLDSEQRLSFASRALLLRYPGGQHAGMQAGQLLEARRSEDAGDDVWRVYNTIQENVIQGDQLRQSASGRQLRSRPIRAIARDVEINTGLWQIAVGLVN